MRVKFPLAAAFLLAVLPLAVLSLALVSSAGATDFSPPMLDVSAMCGRTFHAVSAMSECVVAESEARAELLAHWDKYPDAAAEKCIKLGKKAKREPYVAMAKCLAPETAALAAAPPAEVKR